MIPRSNDSCLGSDLSANRICAKKSDSVWLLHVSSLSHLPVWTLIRGPLPVRGRWTVTTGNKMSSCPPLWCLSPCWSSPCFLHCNRHTYSETHWFSCLSLCLWQTLRPPPFSTLLLLKDQWRCTAASSKRAAHTQATIESGSWPSGRHVWAELFSEKKITK